MAALERSWKTRVRLVRPLADPNTIVVIMRGPLAAADIPVVCRRLHRLLEGCDAGVVVCDVGALVDSDAAVVDALARLRLTARRLGREMRLRHPSEELLELIALAGLCDLLPLVTGLPVEPRGEAEEGEQPLGVEEEGEAADPAV